MSSGSGFKEFWFSLSVEERDAFAADAITSRGNLTQVAYGNNEIELGLADVICVISENRVTLDDLPLTAKAQQQRKIRESVSAEAGAGR